jgi:hypothetical protein
MCRLNYSSLSHSTGILVGILFHSPWVGVKNTYFEGLLRYLVGMFVKLIFKNGMCFRFHL